MKEKYSKPQSDVQEFGILDFVSTSGNPIIDKDPADDNPIEWGS